MKRRRTAVIKEAARATAAGDIDTVARLGSHNGYDPRILWPGTDPARLMAAKDAVIRAVRALLAGERGVALDSHIADRRTFGIAALTLGVGPLLGSWVERGALEAREGTADVLLEHLNQSRRRLDRLTGEAVRVIRVLRADGIDPIALKGIALHPLYDVPATRHFQDIDLFIAPHDAVRAEAVMRRLGFVPSVLGAGRRRNWNAPNVRLPTLEMIHADGPWGVDLHYGLGRIFHTGLVGDLPEPEPDRCPTITVGDLSVPTLAPALHAALLVLHVSSNLYQLQLMTFVDITVLSRQPDAAAWWAELPGLLDRWGSTRFALPAVSLLERLAPGTAPPDLRAAIEAAASPRLRRAAAAMPLTGLEARDRFRRTFFMLWATSPIDVWRVIAARFLTARQRRARDYRRFKADLDARYGSGAVNYLLGDPM